MLFKKSLCLSLSVSLSLSDTTMPPLLILCFLVCMKVSVCQTRAGFVNIDVHDFYSGLVPFLLALCLSVVLLSCGSVCLSSPPVFLLLLVMGVIIHWVIVVRVICFCVCCQLRITNTVDLHQGSTILTSMQYKPGVYLFYIECIWGKL